MEHEKENVDPTQQLQWQGIDDPKNISTDSLEANLPQVIDTNSETSTSFLIDRSIGPALIGTTSSMDSPAIGGPPMREDGDAKGGSQTPTGPNEYHRESVLNQEAVEYADGLARELINVTHDMEEILYNNQHSAAIQDEDTQQQQHQQGDEEKLASSTRETTEEVLVEAHHEEPPGKQEEVEKKIEKVDLDLEEINWEEEKEVDIDKELEFSEEAKVDEVKVEEALVELEDKKETIADLVENKHEDIIDLRENQEPEEETTEEEENHNIISLQPPPTDDSPAQQQEAHQSSFQTAAATSLIVDCDKLEDEMEFTKNYSDDLLMGQNDPGSAQGETMPSADLADFELPPYSASSSASGEAPRQHSPVERKSSNSSSAAQPSSSHHNNVESSSPNLTGFKNLLMSSYSRVSHVLHWQRPIESGIIFGVGLTLIITLTFLSIISVFAYSALGIILASALIRVYKSVSKALNRSSELPFDHIWNKIQGLNVSLPPEKTHELVDASLGNLIASFMYLKQVLLFEDKIATVKFGFFLYMLTYIGAWFNGMTLITIAYLALFSVPIFYEKNKTKIDEYFNLAFGQLSSTISLVTNKATSLAFGGSSSPPVDGTNSKKQN